jgi:hypothetical protein
MTPEQAKILRDVFPAEMIGKLPRVTCKACSDSPRRHCDSHAKADCRVCGNWISVKHIHLDYVGHADVTDRLLEADAGWYWEPVAFGPDGLPLFDKDGGLWIRLTIGGVTRMGYGDADGKRGGKATKEAIGDAIRNAAMRFGVALDLWSKSDRAEAAIKETQPQAAAEDQAVTNAKRIHQEILAADDKTSFDSSWKTIGFAEKNRQIVKEDAEKLRGIWKDRKTEWNEAQAKKAAAEINDGG